MAEDAKKNAFKKGFNGEYNDDTKNLCKLMYLGKHRPDGFNYKKSLASIAQYTGIKKSAIVNWQRRGNWDAEFEVEVENERMETNDDVVALISSIKINNLRSIERFCRTNMDLNNNDDLKKRIDGLKVMLAVEEELIPENERGNYSSNKILKELDEFESSLTKKMRVAN